MFYVPTYAEIEAALKAAGKAGVSCPDGYFAVHDTGDSTYTIAMHKSGAVADTWHEHSCHSAVVELVERVRGRILRQIIDSYRSAADLERVGKEMRRVAWHHHDHDGAQYDHFALVAGDPGHADYIVLYDAPHARDAGEFEFRAFSAEHCWQVAQSNDGSERAAEIQAALFEIEFPEPISRADYLANQM